MEIIVQAGLKLRRKNHNARAVSIDTRVSQMPIFFRIIGQQIHLEHNSLKNASKESLFCDKRKFKRLIMALMMPYGYFTHLHPFKRV